MENDVCTRRSRSPQGKRAPVLLVLAGAALTFAVVAYGGPGAQRAPVASAAPAADAKQAPPPARKPGYIVGRARFESGGPIARFSVQAYGFDGKVNLGTTIPSLGAAEGRSGRYQLQTVDTVTHKKPVGALVVGVTAQAKLTYRGRKYVVELHPVDGKRNGSGATDFRGDSRRGVVRDFVMRMTGTKPGYGSYKGQETSTDSDSTGAFYGGSVILALELGDAQAGAVLTTTLTAQGPLLDGSVRGPLKRAIAITGPRSYVYLHGIPLGIYSASVQLATPGGPAQGLRVGLLGKPTAGSRVPLAFLPTPTFPGGNAVITVNVVR